MGEESSYPWAPVITFLTVRTVTVISRCRRFPEKKERDFTNDAFHLR